MKSEYEKQKTRFEAWLHTHNLLELSPYIADILDVDKLLKLAFDERKDHLSLHASWLLEKYMMTNPPEKKKILDAVMTDIHHINIDGSRRILGNIVLQELKENATNNLPVAQSEALSELFFDWIISPACPVAVIANCYELLAYLSLRHVWIQDELHTLIEAHLSNGASAAVRSRGLRVKKWLKKNT